MKLTEARKIWILYFLIFCATAAWLPLFFDYCKEQGLNESQASIVVAIVPLLMFLVQPFYGMLADRLGYKRCLIISSFLTAITYGLYFFAGGFLYLVLVTVVLAVFYNALMPLLDSLSLKLVENNPKFSYGTLRIAGAAGFAFTSIITGQLIDAINMTVIFVVSAIAMFLAFIFSFALSADKKNGTAADQASFKNLRSILNSKTLLFLLFCIFLISAGTTPIWYFYSTYMKENGASASLVGYGLSFMALCELPLFYFSARIISRFGLKTTLLITVLATVIRMLLYVAISNPRAALAIELLHGFSWSLFWVVSVEYVNKLVKHEWKATGMSLLSASYYGIGYTVGNLWAGELAHSQLRVSEIFLINAGIVGLAGILIWVFLKKREKAG